MKRLLTCLSFLFLSVFVSFSQNIPTPSSHLGYSLGSKFTFHHKVVSYFTKVAEVSPKVTLTSYGETNEGRPLLLAFISSEENLKKLESIRQDNLIKTGFLEGEYKNNQKPIVWLSYNVHGNEASSTEAAMKALYTLAEGNEKVNRWLEEVIVVIDPCINPDGRDRYANWVVQANNLNPNSNPDSWEHHEPWPGGRFNHYLFDLNRDWAWQTQAESQQRVKAYQQWMPHVHIDFHEMGYGSSYFFGPAAEPFHKDITDWQREFHTKAGKNHASYFDKNNWLYFTKETYDLFYPSYGDTWPTYNGAIGFTFEQGGSGRAGRAIKLENGNELTLKDRLEHHFTTSLSTIEVAYESREKLLQEFNQFFEINRNNPIGEYKTYIVKGSNDPRKIEALTKLLDNQQITYGMAEVPAKNRPVTGFDYRSNKNGSYQVSTNDLVISAYQPNSRFLKILFEPKSELADSLTYDLTAWAIPYAYDLDAFATSQRINPTSEKPAFKQAPLQKGNQPYAYLLPWKSFEDARFLASILKKKVKARFAEKAFTLNGKDYPAGSLVITRTDNIAMGENFDAVIEETAGKLNVPLEKASTGFVDSGKDFGSGDVHLIKAPKIALVNGDGVSPTLFGELWHYFEKALEYEVTVLPTHRISGTDLSKYHVVILPSGRYDEYSNPILSYIQSGGKVIALDRAVNFLANAEGTSLDVANKSGGAIKDELRYENRERSAISNYVPGSIYRASLDNSHPLAFGYDNSFFLLKRNATVFSPLSSGWNVGKFETDALVSGFVGSNLKKQIPDSFALGTESMGSGEVVYFPDSPVFRGFWEGGKLMLANAIFFVGQ